MSACLRRILNHTVTISVKYMASPLFISLARSVYKVLLDRWWEKSNFFSFGSFSQNQWKTELKVQNSTPRVDHHNIILKCSLPTLRICVQCTTLIHLHVKWSCRSIMVHSLSYLYGFLYVLLVFHYTTDVSTLLLERCTPPEDMCTVYTSYTPPFQMKL